ncbi:ATP binding protein, putative [Ricinus communis]|uniref:ATP binding protein, putative n=1 Tax=Ricinus communis TaxID=3988 RepID=B9RZY0_RICCO|nr:ATP binding protein, putative [Ricinus communis]
MSSSSRNPNPQNEANENQFENSQNSAHLPPTRAPLNTIPDPSQYRRDIYDSDFDSKDKLETAPAGRLIGTYGTPRVSTRQGKQLSARSGSRASLGGYSRSATHFTKGKDASSTHRLSRGLAVDFSAETPHFDLDKDPSFWADHNVQVLIRIRPLSNMEAVSQGYGRCLKQESSQTLLWLGHPETRFTFDHIASETISQEKLFRVIGLPMVENCMSGYNSCMFAYGQTGSGKTYTMMGEINQIEDKLSEDCGITARIFEYLFSRIKMEEESRRNEKLRFSCKCSFLEIYNEQITDLLEPSSTNLQLREDSRKGVYVENLTEYNVKTVNDVTKLLSQGAANRKMAATNMNSESSRSHSVFTCIIESWWEKDSMTHFRFARLNLVDLAGSERQKSSGAEGGRLKEAANINKSLSTLGLVIMSLVDLAHGKHRHVPYRDSRLTFLLQDSLGGNSKTTIIANISPSMCSAHETLSTLKFAQRAKLIQNNAKVNEDASGDVGTLQRQIQLLKDQLSFLRKHHNLSMPVSSCVTNFEESSLACNPQIINSAKEERVADNHNLANIAYEKMKSMEAALVGALRREKMAQKERKKLEAEIEHVNQFVCQREEELQRTKMMLRLREAKIKHLESLVDGSLPADNFLMDENKALKEEIMLLQARIDKNPELTRFALENLRLLEQLHVFQNYYEQGERETLVAETSELREQLLDMLERKLEFSSRYENQDDAILEELVECRKMNSKLMREVEDLKAELKKYSSCTQAAFDTVDTVYTESDSGDELASDSQAFQGKLEKLTKDLEQARLLNCKYQEDQASQLSHQHQVELIREQVETETTRTILHLHEEVTSLQSELNGKLCCMTHENMKLRNSIEAKEEEIQMLCGEWERATFELTSFLIEGSKSLEDASGQIENMVFSFPRVNVFIREHVERAARACIDKEETILRLEKSVEDAQKMVMEMELKLNSLKEATIALNEFPQSDSDQSIEETINLRMLLKEKINMIKLLERQLKCKEDCILEAEKRADAAFLVVKWLSGCDKVHIAAMQRDIFEASTTYMNCIHNLVNEIQEMKSKCMELKEHRISSQSSTFKLQALESLRFQHFESEHILHSLRDELAKVNDRLKIIEDSISRKVRAYRYPLTEEYLAEADNRSPDNSLSSYSTLDSDFSNEIVSPDKLSGLSHTCCSEFSGEITEQMVNLKFQMGSSVEPGSEDLKELLKKSHGDEALKFCLRMELNLAFDAFNKLYAHLTTILDENNIVDISHPGGMKKCFGLMMEIAEASDPNNGKVASNDKVNHASTFFCKFEEARATMKEADHMLNALLKENENAKGLNYKWKQASEQLMVEKSHLIEENEQLKALINLKEEENKLQLDENFHGLLEVAKSISTIEGCFLQMEREVDDNYKVLYSDLLCMGKEMLQFICNSRSLLEDIFSEIMEKEFAHSVVYQCVVGEINHKIPRFGVQSEIPSFGQQECHINISQNVCTSSQDDIIITNKKVAEAEELISDLEEGGLGLSYEDMMYEKLSLKKELERKEILLNGLLFDFSLLQEAASERKDIKDETEKLILAMSEVRHELEMKTSQFDNLLVRYGKVEGHLADTENALSISNSDLAHAKERIDTLSDQNAELRMLLKDLYLKKSEAEEQLEEQKEIIRVLEKEIIHLTSSVEQKICSSVEDMKEELRNATNERDQLQEEICSLNDQLEMAYALADEKEAIAVESRQESEASKIYAEQKEEEVKILENSVEELESTINVLEKKVYEMDEEVERHRMIRESLELELQDLRQRLLTVENFTDIVDSGNTISVQIEDPISRHLNTKSLELHEAHNQIRLLKRDIAEKDEEIKQCKEYISELVLHSEAQASQYQEKYKNLEAMVHEVRTNSVSSASAAATLDKSEKSSVRTRGSSSPFRCISNLVQQMNLEKDHELSVAKLRVEELEAMLASRQKEVCVLHARLAAAESMTHDVIRDLLGVQLDMNNYANIIDQLQVQKLVEAAHQHTEEFNAKEQEILNLRRQINDLMEEKESCISETNAKVADLLAAEMRLEQLQDRDQLLSAQNEMLKMDKTNLLKRVAELDEMVKTLLGTQSTRQQIQRTKTKEKGTLTMENGNLTKRLAHSEKLLSLVNNELAQYRKSGGNYPHFDYGHSSSSRR